jgi:hypothetical protein
MSQKIELFRALTGRQSLCVLFSIRQLGSKAVAACLPSVLLRWLLDRTKGRKSDDDDDGPVVRHPSEMTGRKLPPIFPP